MVDLSRAIWQKSTYSNTNGCVELAFIDDQVAVRNSRDSSGPVLIFTSIEWNAFVCAVRDGQLRGPTGPSGVTT
jgi:Domain of unknown function (DUF397)